MNIGISDQLVNDHVGEVNYRSQQQKPVTYNGSNQQRLCFRCRSSNHLIKDCPELPIQTIKKPIQNETYKETRTCFRCNIPGHIARFCRVNLDKKN